MIETQKEKQPPKPKDQIRSLGDKLAAEATIRRIQDLRKKEQEQSPNKPKDP